MLASSTDNGKPLGPFAWTMGVLGTVVTTSAVISLVQHWSDITLAEIPAQYVDYYRSIMRILVDWIPLPFDWSIPQWYLDALTINGIIASAAVRAVYSVGYFQAKFFAYLTWASALLLLGWLVGPLLVEWLNRFTKTSIKDANERLARMRVEVEHRKVRPPGNKKDFVREQIKSDEEIVKMYAHFLGVRRAFRLGLALIVIATVVFFILNSLAPQPRA